MKAVTIDESGALVVSNDVSEPVLSSGQVKIRVLAGGICGSDLDALDRLLGKRGERKIIGHEAGGEVVAVAEDVTGLMPGDLVVVEPNYACLRCEWCQQGQTKMCAERIVVSKDTPGLFAEFVVVPAPFAWRVPPKTDLATLAAFEANMVARVALERMNVTPEDTVLVIGAGSQGQAVSRMLLEGGKKPSVIEPQPEKLRIAIESGCRDAAANYEERFSVVFETSGTGPGLTTGIDRAEKLGRICLIGQTYDPIPIVTRPIVQKELTIQGSVIYNHPSDFKEAVIDLSNGQFDPRAGLRAPMSPEAAVQALPNARELDGKIWIDFSSWATG